MEIFRPFYGEGWTLKTFNTRQSTPEAMFCSSLTQLERLALEYRQNHASAASSIFWHLSLLYIGNAVVRHLAGPTWHFNFLLCMYAYADLAGSFRVAEGFLRAILCMALERELIQSTEAQVILDRLPSEEGSETIGTGVKKRVESGHTADYDRARNDHSVSQVTVLVDRLDEELAFQEFVSNAQDGYGKLLCTDWSKNKC